MIIGDRRRCCFIELCFFYDLFRDKRICANFDIEKNANEYSIGVTFFSITFENLIK